MRLGHPVSDPATADEAVEGYRLLQRRNVLWILAMAVLTFVAFLISVFTNQISSITAGDVWDVICGRLFGGSGSYPLAETVVWDYSMPRALMGIAVGAVLGMGGAIMQVLLRNPLATPYTTGVSSGASLGAALYIYLDFALVSTGNYTMTVAINAIVFAMLPTLAIILVSYQKHITPTTMILAGIAIMYLFSAITTFLMLTSSSETVESAYRWTVGSLGRADWDNLKVTVLGVVPCMIVLGLLTRQIHLMNAGQRTATTLGVRVRLVRNVAILVVSVMTAITVGITGGIGFMGLIAPHLSRILVGSDMKYLLPCSALMSATILLVADAIAEVITPSGIPVGVITSVIGGPLFIAILIKSAKKVWF